MTEDYSDRSKWSDVRLIGEYLIWIKDTKNTHTCREQHIVDIRAALLVRMKPEADGWIPCANDGKFEYYVRPVPPQESPAENKEDMEWMEVYRENFPLLQLQLNDTLYYFDGYEEKVKELQLEKWKTLGETAAVKLTRRVRKPVNIPALSNDVHHIAPSAVSPTKKNSDFAAAWRMKWK